MCVNLFEMLRQPAVFGVINRAFDERGHILPESVLQHGQKIISFTRRSDSTLAQLSDLVFVVDGAKQTLAGSLPNLFFGHIILIFEELMARFFSPAPDAQ